MSISLRQTCSAFLAGEPFAPNHDLAVVNPFDGRMASRVPLADPGAIDQAIAAAVRAAPAMRDLAAHHRAEVLRHCRRRFEQRRRELAEACSVEAGKPIKYAEGEVERLIDTFRFACQEALRANGGEVIPLDISPRALKTLEAVSVIAAEDTRHTGKPCTRADFFRILHWLGCARCRRSHHLQQRDRSALVRR